jgi:hypothetical protein
MSLNLPRLPGKCEMPSHHNSHRRDGGKHEEGRDQATPTTKTCRWGPRQGTREQGTKRTRNQRGKGLRGERSSVERAGYTQTFQPGEFQNQHFLFAEPE